MSYYIQFYSYPALKRCGICDKVIPCNSSVSFCMECYGEALLQINPEDNHEEED